MVKSFLPPNPEEMFPSRQLDSRDLLAFRDSKMSQEVVLRAHREIYSRELRLSDQSNDEGLQEKRGIIKGIKLILSIMDTIATEISSGEAETTQGEGNDIDARS